MAAPRRVLGVACQADLPRACQHDVARGTARATNPAPVCRGTVQHT
jgi:hypothetical protein